MCVRERHFHWWVRDREVAREPESGCRALLPCPMAHARRHAGAVSCARATAARTAKSFPALRKTGGLRRSASWCWLLACTTQPPSSSDEAAAPWICFETPQHRNQAPRRARRRIEPNGAHTHPSSNDTPTRASEAPLFSYEIVEEKLTPRRRVLQTELSV